MSETIALVTGASRGIGKAIAKELAIKGHHVVGTSTSDEGARAISTDLAEWQGRGMVLQLGDRESMNKQLDAIISECGSPAVLVNNAGITEDNLIIRMKEEQWDRVIDVNLTCAFLLTQRCLKLMMKARYGRIINITSVVGIMGNAGQANYAAAKAGIGGLTRSAALESASRGVTVNAIAPGFIETDMTSN